MSHTPGPWILDSCLSEPYLHDICMANPPPCAGNPVVLATIYHDEDEDKYPSLAEANANARLIAAAPALLAALEECAGRLSFLDAGECPEIIAARAAIAAAGGHS